MLVNLSDVFRAPAPKTVGMLSLNQKRASVKSVLVSPCDLKTTSIHENYKFPSILWNMLVVCPELSEVWWITVSAA